jgi:hypothetical protein
MTFQRRVGFKPENAARTAGYALAAGDAVAIDHGFSQTGMHPDIDPNWAIVGTDTALDTADRLWDHLSGGQSLPALFFPVEHASKHE